MPLDVTHTNLAHLEAVGYLLHMVPLQRVGTPAVAPEH